MKIVTAQQMRRIDQAAISEFGVPGEVLMERAGYGVADIVQRLARVSDNSHARVKLFAGKGNNGGDAFVAALHLGNRGFDVEVLLAGEMNKVSGDALTHLERMKSANVKLRELPTAAEWDTVDYSRLRDAILVDGILGTGISGTVRGPAAAAIRHIRAASDRNLVVAIDVPSGLDADTGTARGEAVAADITATMGLAKSGLIEPCSADFVGTVEVVDIGIPDKLVRSVKSDRELVTTADIRRFFHRRASRAHKGDFGKVLLIGGAAGYAGAIAMATAAAARSGAGLLTALVPRRIASVVAAIVPEAMVHAGAETEIGSLSREAVKKWNRDVNDFDAVLMGPGMTTHEDTRSLVEQILREARVPLVLDADALNVCRSDLAFIKQSACPLVITPHPGEMARLLGCAAAEVQADRFKAAQTVAENTGAVVALKGAGTIIAASDRSPNINMTGNPGMATGGMGDVLGGMIVGLAAQRFEPFDAARTAVFLHGRAGDHVAWRTSQAGMIASDVIEKLPIVFREVAAR